MPTAQMSVAEIIVTGLVPAACEDEESSVVRGRQALAHSRSPSHWLARLFAGWRSRFPVSHRAESLQMSLEQLAETSPHLLTDIGIDPETGGMLTEALLPARPDMSSQQQVPEMQRARVPSEKGARRPGVGSVSGILRPIAPGWWDYA